MKQAVFLVGGFGSRLADLTRRTPKPLLDVGGRPFLEYLLDEAARHGFSDILLLAGYRGEDVLGRYHGRRWRGAQIRVLCETQPLGTGGALRFALPHLAPQFLLANGDSFFDINLLALAAALPSEGMAMALRAAAGSRYGRVGLSAGRVVGFHAPQTGVEGPINAGIYVMHRAVVNRIPQGKASLESDVFPDLAAAGRIRGWPAGGYFIDIGIAEDFARAQHEMPQQVRRPAIFFDRDGVLNADKGHVHRMEDFVWLDGAMDAVRLGNDRGYFAFVVSNQAGVAHGLYDREAVERLHDWMNEQLAAKGAHVDAFEYCPHHAEAKVPAYRIACRRRKPEPGMILDLLQGWPVDRSRSFLVGNMESDLAAARAAGIAGHFFKGGNLEQFIRGHFPA
ncbi:MAG: HAD-IIIA family hydrolase [Rhizomicrobium sp.]